MSAKHHKDFMKFTKKSKETLVEAIKADIAFLRREGLMDYSLLLGIELMK